MTSFLGEHPFKIFLNSLQNLIGITFPKTLYEPIMGICRLLVEITSLANGQYVDLGISTAGLEGNEMLLMQDPRLVPEAGRIAAIGTATMPVIYSSHPVSFSEVVRQRALLGSSLLILCAFLLRIQKTALFGLLIYGFAVGLMIDATPRTSFVDIAPITAANFGSYCLWMIVSPAFLDFFYAFWMTSSISCRSFTRNFGMQMIASSVPFQNQVMVSFTVTARSLTTAIGMQIRPAFIAGIHFLGIGSLPIQDVLAMAWTTLRSQLTVQSAKILFGGWKILTAGSAALEGKGDIQHSVSLSLHHKWLSADGVIRRRFGSYPSRPLYYTTGFVHEPR